MADEGLPGVIVGVLVLALIIVVGIAITGAVADVTDTRSDLETRDDTVLLSGTSWVDVVPDQYGKGTDQVVRDSRGFALRFTGADDSTLQSDGGFDAAQGSNWTIGTGAWVNASAVDSNNMTALAVGGPDVILRYENASGGAQWSAYVVQQSGTHQVNVSEPDPQNMSYVWVTRAGDDVTIHRYNATGNTTGETANVSTAGDVSGSLVASENWHGRLDETRLFNSTLNATQRQQVVDAPVRPLTSADRTGRLMYDAGSGTSVNIYWAGVDATASNVSYADGFDGTELDEDTLLTSGDYKWREDGPELKPLAGGALDSAPVAFVEHDFSSLKSAPMKNIADVYDLAPVILIALVASALMMVVGRVRE